MAELELPKPPLERRVSEFLIPLPDFPFQFPNFSFDLTLMIVKVR